MSFKKIFPTLVFSFLFFFNFNLLASDAPKADEHAAPKGDDHATPKGDSHSAPSGGGASGGQKQFLPEWVEMQSRLMGLETQMAQKRETIRRLISEKEHLKPNAPQLKGVISEMVATHKELQKLIDDYQKESTIFKYRFPERGSKGERTYEPLDQKALQEMNIELGLDGRMARNLKKIRSQYKMKKSDPSAEKSADEQKASQKAHDSLNDPSKSSGETVIIIQK